LPALLEELSHFGLRASFFLSLGPDRSGRAIFRVFTKPGFARKMMRTGAARMYGWKTALYGTLLPSPLIGKRCRSVLRQVAEAGHEVGLHAWDHTTWQDRLQHMKRDAIAAHLDRGSDEFAAIYGRRPTSFAAPAWWCTETALALIAERGFDYVSISRGTDAPFRPAVAGRALDLVEIPTTLSTFDEDLGRDGTTLGNYIDRLTARYRPGFDEILTVHAESEGGAYRSLFRDLLARHQQMGVVAPTLGEVAARARAHGELAVRPLVEGHIPGRAGAVMVPGTPLKAATAPRSAVS
jgi:undecaprenyl phosphate-alpha-L-ara4FN deformylase